MQATMPLMPQTGLGQIHAADPRLNLKEGDTVRMKEAAQQFESQYVFQLMELMAPKIGDADGVASAGFAEETFRPQLHEAIAKEVTRKGGFGIAENVYKELLISQTRGAGVTITPDVAAASYAETEAELR